MSAAHREDTFHLHPLAYSKNGLQSWRTAHGRVYAHCLSALPSLQMRLWITERLRWPAQTDEKQKKVRRSLQTWLHQGERWKVKGRELSCKMLTMTDQGPHALTSPPLQPCLPPLYPYFTWPQPHSLCVLWRASSCPPTRLAKPRLIVLRSAQMSPAQETLLDTPQPARNRAAHLCTLKFPFMALRKWSSSLCTRMFICLLSVSTLASMLHEGRAMSVCSPLTL